MAFLNKEPLQLLHLRRSKDPVSPINIFAGCKLNIKNPKQAPHKIDPKSEISNISYLTAITVRQAIIIIDIEAPSPSIPSVKFTAFVAASITKITNGIYKNAGNIISNFSPGIIVPVPTPILIKYNAYITEIISNPKHFISWF